MKRLAVFHLKKWRIYFINLHFKQNCSKFKPVLKQAGVPDTWTESVKRIVIYRSSSLQKRIHHKT